ncbi:hypothetical protein K488DRAFT_71448 [Vararia minispora EC-137]|uniref:Uncharacterized protein n=1 Tax=Vararia minispora EC-137 TaxID=1314806 RepID=A0ACB8QI96_9AGAM|nr:hypothetical protein K488DRAFT_71448 [Vararia minispora EC-137]
MSFLSVIGIRDDADPTGIVLPKLKVLQLHDAAGLSLAFLSRLDLPPDVYMNISMHSERELPPVAYFEYGLQPHIQRLLELRHLYSLSIVTSPHLAISIVPIGFDEFSPTAEEIVAENRPGPGVVTETVVSAVHNSGSPRRASITDWMWFASYWLFPYTNLVVRLDIVPSGNLMPCQWMEYLDPFTAVDTLSLPAQGRHGSSANLLTALTSRPTRVLPNLTSLVIKLGHSADDEVEWLEVGELGQLITDLVLSRLQTGRDTVIERVRFETPAEGPHLASSAGLVNSLQIYVPDVECVSVHR